MYINPQRLEVADLSRIYWSATRSSCATGNPKHIDGTATLCGLRVAAPVGTVFENSAKQASADCKAAGKPEITCYRSPAQRTAPWR